MVLFIVLPLQNAIRSEETTPDKEKPSIATSAEQSKIHSDTSQKKHPAKNKKEARKQNPFGGDGDFERGVAFIKEHTKELNISEDQKKKFEETQKAIQEKFATLKEDPDLRELFKEQFEARQNQDREHIVEMRKKLRDALEEKGIHVAEIALAVTKILTPEQLLKLAELRKQNGRERNPLKRMREERREEQRNSQPNRPNPDKGVPTLYENEHTPTEKF
jgi:hypothetical protein